MTLRHTTMEASGDSASPWSALGYPAFRRLFCGANGMAIGFTTVTTLAAWLMASLTPSAMMVALVQTATTLPALLFGLLAGAMADTFDRRGMILATQVLLLVASISLGTMSLFGMMGPALLLGCVFVIGAGFTFYLPALQALIHDLVPHRELPSATALISTAFSAARIIGPALAATAAAQLGSGWASLGSAGFFLVMIVALRGWQSAAPGIPGLPERLFASIRSGLRYTRHTPEIRSMLAQYLGFGFCSISLVALLPVVARDQFGFGALGFGMLSACFGLGAVAGAQTTPRLLRKGRVHTAITTAMIFSAGGTLLTAATSFTTVAVAGTIFAGFGWGCMYAALAAGSQNTAPAWVRARAVSVCLVVAQAAMALGSAVWGAVASVAEPRFALIGSALLLLLLLAVNRRNRLFLKDEADTTAGVHLPELSFAFEPMPDDGPVLIQIEYAIDAENEQDFLHLIRSMEPIRRRNGAMNWNIFRDLEVTGRFVERFAVHSWAEYMRLRARITATERTLADGVAQTQRTGIPVKISRLIAIAPGQSAAVRAGY